jgi:hypothetical protein
MKQRIKNWLLSELLCAQVVEDIITQDKQKNIYIGGEKITQQELKVIQEEIKFVKETRLWSIINETIKADAQRKMFVSAKTTDDLFAGKMMLYNLDLINKCISVLTNS